jgi:hypothetical protein
MRPHCPKSGADLDIMFARQFRPRPVLAYRRAEAGPVWMTNKRWARRILRLLAYAGAVAFGVFGILAFIGAVAAFR